jgi:hypothetical protein
MNQIYVSIDSYLCEKFKFSKIMEEVSLIDSLAELLRMPEKWMIQDDEENLHELSDGIKGVPVLVTAKYEIYRLYFGKERINASHMAILDEIHTALMQFIWSNFSHKVKLEIQEEMGALLEKYNLKKIKKREKK